MFNGIGLNDLEGSGVLLNKRAAGNAGLHRGFRLDTLGPACSRLPDEILERELTGFMISMQRNLPMKIGPLVLVDGQRILSSSNHVTLSTEWFAK